MLYVIVIVAVLACILMAVLDKTGVAPSPLSDRDKTADKAEAVEFSSVPEELQKLYKENKIYSNKRGPPSLIESNINSLQLAGI